MTAVPYEPAGEDRTATPQGAGPGDDGDEAAFRRESAERAERARAFGAAFAADNAELMERLR